MDVIIVPARRDIQPLLLLKVDVELINTSPFTTL